MKLIDLTIQTISSFGMNSGYIVYRRICLGFSSAALVPIAEKVVTRLYELMSGLLGDGGGYQLQQRDNSIFEKYAQLFYSIFSYNFNVSYYDFETD